MIKDKNILVVGGDLRQVTLIKLLSKNNIVFSIGIEKTNETAYSSKTIEEIKELNISFAYIILPILVILEKDIVNTPFSSSIINIYDVLKLADKNTIVLGGKITEELKTYFEKENIIYYNYLEREELLIQNAVPTAEGAIQIAMEELPKTIFNLNILILGYGRISKVISRYLKALGGKITVSARRFSDLALLDINGYKKIHTNNIKDILKEQELIINTVPSLILNKENLDCVNKNSLIIDLASLPGGVDISYANKKGIKTIRALSLPGKVAPITAGEIIYNTISNIDCERSIENG